MINEIKQDAQERMKKSVEALEHAFAKIRTGRAHPALLDSIIVSYYGADTPLRQVANVNVSQQMVINNTVGTTVRALSVRTAAAPRGGVMRSRGLMRNGGVMRSNVRSLFGV
mgnify:CR=1 FL=1